mgnify:CR=1 FL=1
MDYKDLVNGYLKVFPTKEIAQQKVKEFMDKLDFNNNGTIDYSEFLIANIDLKKLLNNEKLQREAFDLFDLDKSGTITIDEI